MAQQADKLYAEYDQSHPYTSGGVAEMSTPAGVQGPRPEPFP